MIEKKYNGYQIHCDNCTNSIYMPTADTFKSAINSSKQSGWINRQINDEWHNFCCEKCYEDIKNV